MIILASEATDILSTILVWFAVITLIALVLGAVIFFLKVYLITSIIGQRKESVSWTQCHYCRAYTPPDSVYCKSCGARLR